MSLFSPGFGMSPATWANRKINVHLPPSQSSIIHLDFVSAYPPLWTVFTDPSLPPPEAFFSTGNLLFRLGLLWVDSWDSWCWLHWKPFLLPSDGMSKQAAAGWVQCLPAVSLHQWPSHPWLSCDYRETDQSCLPLLSLGGSWWPTALICCIHWKCPWWFNMGMKCKWCITTIAMILVELVESSFYPGITYVSPPSFLWPDFPLSWTIAALTVQRLSDKVLPASYFLKLCLNGLVSRAVPIFAFIHFQTSYKYT